MFYDDNFINRVKDANDIVDIISPYVSLRKSGSNYMGQCPFHNDRSPSFSVSQSRQFFYCFGCHVGGNVFHFLEMYENMDFPEAVEYLAERGGIPLPEDTSQNVKEVQKKRNEAEEMHQIYRETATFYMENLKKPEGKPGLQYFQERGLQPVTIFEFALGYADKSGDSLYRHLKGKGYPDRVLQKSGLFYFDEKSGARDRFWNRVMFPIIDSRKHVIAFGGRVLGEGKPKYLNSPETMIFNKRKHLFAYNLARNQGKHGLILCEGYMDVISLHQAGFKQAVASLGTAFTEEQCKLITRITHNVYLCYDSDFAGTDAAMRAIPMLMENGLTVKIIHLAPCKDPDELIKKYGAEEFQKRLDQAETFYTFQVSNLERDYDLKSAEGKTEFILKVAEYCAEIEDEITRGFYRDYVCERYHVEERAFEKRIREAARRKEQEGRKREDVEIRKNQRESMQPERVDEKSREVLLNWITCYPEIYSQIREYVPLEEYGGESLRSLAGMIYEQAENGKVDVPSILMKIEDEEMRNRVSGILCGNQLVNEDKKSYEKAITDVVRRIGRERYQRELREMSQSKNGDSEKMSSIVKKMQSINLVEIHLN